MPIAEPTIKTAVANNQRFAQSTGRFCCLGSNRLTFVAASEVDKASSTRGFNRRSAIASAAILASTCLLFNPQQTDNALKHRLLIVLGIPQLASEISLSASSVNNGGPL